MLTSCILLGVLMTLSMMPENESNFSMMLDSPSMMSVTSSISLVSLSFFLLIALISMSVFIWSSYYMGETYKLSLFFTTLTLFVLSMLLLTLSNSVLLLFLGWEGLGMTSFLLIVFYQNWMSFKGGLVTLLTNRLGDAVLILSFCYWLLVSSSFSLSSVAFGIIFLSLTLTKSAQWPFISWLPAAMAAPTPVSALVHSSTLVTAGVWLVIRFGMDTSINNLLMSSLGLITLSVASFSALMEMDAKKVVALSTLSQLGLMFFSLAVGTPVLCTFHILMHAMAKANLFMIVGIILHSSFAQQDTRGIVYTLEGSLSLGMVISMMSLSGLVFSSGFFSKEQILMNHFIVFNSSLSYALLLVISALTVAYCIKLYISLNTKTILAVIQTPMMSWSGVYPIMGLTSASVFMGSAFSWNLSAFPFFKETSSSGIYWSFLILGVLLMKTSVSELILIFHTHTKMGGFLFLPSLMKLKQSALVLEKSLADALLMSTSLKSGSLIKQSSNLLLFMSLTLLMMVAL